MDPLNAITQLFQKLVSDEKEHAGTLLNKARSDDIPVIEDTLQNLLILETRLLASSDETERARIQQEAATRMHTLEAIAVRYEIKAAHEARRFFTRLKQFGIDALFATIDTVFPPLREPTG